MKPMNSRHLAILFVGSLAILAAGMIWNGVRQEISRHQNPVPAVGTAIDSLHGIPVYSNGPHTHTSHGKHFGTDGFYYGHQWQCVEFVKRYYYDHFKHEMPDGWGHARHFYDPEVEHGQTNLRRGLLQFDNGGSAPPQAGDLLVYVFGQYGHVAIISQVNKDTVEIIQQNVPGQSRDTLSLKHSQGNWTIGNEHIAGWLRLPGAKPSIQEKGSSMPRERREPATPPA